MRPLDRRSLRLILGIAIVVMVCGLFVATAGAAVPNCRPGHHAVCVHWHGSQCVRWQCQDDPPTIVSEIPSSLIYVVGAMCISVAFFGAGRLRVKRHQPAGS
jgi:hypothetical protein